MKQLIPILFLLLSSSLFAAPKITTSHALALRGTPKYAKNFKHFDYVNPQAPKGGSITMASIGTFDSFHRYGQRGISASGAEDLYDSLFVSSEDEVEVSYGLIAHKAEYPDDFTWMTFHLRPKARFQDGKPITAADVVFSFYKFFNEGVPQYRQYYKNVKKAVALGKYKVRFSLKKPDKEMLLSIASGLKILPKHYWESRNFADPQTTPPIGSSVWKVKNYKMGQFVTYERLKDYWAVDLPVNAGQYNFDQMRFDYYRDETVALEAFKAGEFEFRQENVSKYWANLYKGVNFDKGHIVKEEIPHNIPQSMQAFIFNIKRPFFQDPQVREALTYAMDFEWMNKNLFYSQYTRSRSYFQNTEYEAKGLPSPEELKILEPLRGKIADRVFTATYQPPKSDGSGRIRKNIRHALRLLKKSGWEIKNKVLTQTKTGKKMEFELLLYSPTMERIAIPVQNNLKRFGITMNIRQVDTTQFTNRMRTRDFDMISGGYSANTYPSTNLKIVWRSDYLDYTWNTAGVQDPAIDTLVDGIVAVQQDAEALLHHGRAFDRVLQWNFYVMPQWYINKFRVAYWNKFSRPKIRPRYTLGLDTWWIDPEKEKKLPNRNVK